MNQLSVVNVSKDQFAPQPLTLLIVDDSPLLVMLFEDFFMHCRFTPVCFKSAQEAMEYLESGHHADVLIADYKLSGPLSGVDLSRLAKKRLPDLKTIIITGFDMTPLQERAYAKQYRILKKPFNLFTLKSMVEEITHTHHC